MSRRRDTDVGQIWTIFSDEKKLSEYGEPETTSGGIKPHEMMQIKDLPRWSCNCLNFCDENQVSTIGADFEVGVVNIAGEAVLVQVVEAELQCLSGESR